MKDIAVGLFSDALNAKGIALSGGITAVVSAGINKMLSKRHKLLQEIICSEIRQGNFEGVDEDEVISVFFRLIRDAEEGVARNNLRLMARVINGMAENKELKAPSFLRYANILASLSEKEMRVLAVMVEYKNFQYDSKKEDVRNTALEKITKQAEGHLQALTRTGLVNFRIHDIRDIGPGTYQYSLTKLMDEILEYIPDIHSKEAAA